MRSVSEEFAALLAANHTLLMKATLTLVDGTVFNLTSEDIMAGSVRFEQAVSSDGTFDIGGAIIGTMTATLANQDHRYDGYDLDNATIVAYVGKMLSNNTIEWLRIGTYDVTKPDSYGGTVGITCADRLGRLAKHAYSELSVSYPIYPQALLNAVASHCGVTVSYEVAPMNGGIPISRPPDSDMSLLAAAGYLAQMMGCWLKCNGQGNLVASWYNTSAFESELDGGSFTSDEDDADGGSFTDYSGDLISGGTFAAGNAPIAITDAFKTTVMTDDVTITGVQVTEADEVTLDEEGNETNGATGRTILCGTDEYCLTMSQNPFIAYGQGREVAAGLYTRVGGMRFRPYTNSMPCDPTIEAGDAVTVNSRNGVCKSFVTGVILKPDGAMETRCSAKAPASNTAVVSSPISMTITAIKTSIARSSLEAGAAANLARDAKTSAEEAGSIASEALSGAEAAQELAESTSSYFWTDVEGAHVGTVDRSAHEVDAGYNMTLGATGSTTGIILDHDDETLASFTPSALNFYADGQVAASYTSEGVALYAQDAYDTSQQVASFTQSGVTFFDGSGNTDENVVASFGSNGAYIGSQGGRQIAITNQQLAFMDGGDVVASVTGSEMAISAASIADRLSLGDFAWIPRSNGNLALKWMG